MSAAKTKEDIAATAIRIGTPVTFLQQKTVKNEETGEEHLELDVECPGQIATAAGDGTYGVVFFDVTRGITFVENVRQETDFRLL